MGRRKIEDHYIRNLQKTAAGSTYIVSLPIDVVRDLGWQAKQKLDVRKFGDGILIKDWNPE
jgi:hypothetical protein